MSLIFIASLEHSGSTLLDLVLGGHPQIVGLGEIYQLLRPGSPHFANADNVLCSCGATMSHCSFWGPTLDLLRQQKDSSLAQRYHLVLQSAQDHFGADRLFVDSSKNTAALTQVLELTEWTPQVLFLIRDVRSWTVSMQDGRRRENMFHMRDLWQIDPLRTPQRLITRSAMMHFHRWHAGNRALQAQLTRANPRWLQIGYEELCLYPEHITHLITDFLGLQFSNDMLRIADSHSHSILGNRMRVQPEKRERIFYDNRWFYQEDWIKAAAVMRWVMAYNAKNVYANTRDNIWRA